MCLYKRFIVCSIVCYHRSILSGYIDYILYSVQIKLIMRAPKSPGHDENDDNDHNEYEGH